MLVTLPNLKTYMDVSFTARQEDAAELILAGLQGELEAFLKRPIEPQSFVEEHRLDPTHGGVPMGSFLSLNSNDSYNSTFYDTGSSNSQMNFASTCPTIFLKNTPVISISEVKVKPPFGTERVIVDEVDYITRSYGFDLMNGNSDDLVTVTYTAGLDGATLPVFKLMILRAASREMQNMHDDVVSVKDLTTRNTGPLITGFLDTELSSLRKYRRVRV